LISLKIQELSEKGGGGGEYGIGRCHLGEKIRKGEEKKGGKRNKKQERGKEKGN
jgi:hypothetical protein